MSTLFKSLGFKMTMQCNDHYNTNRQLTKIRDIKVSHPNNIMAAVFDEKYFNSLTHDKQQRLLNCCNSGIENPDSEMGCYACMPDDYEEFKPFFKAVLEK
jgi:creatine kinase